MRLKKELSIVLTILTLSVSFPAIAGHEHHKAGSGPNPFRDCGIGAAIFPNHRIPAAISNIIWDLGTTAVTSATMSPETCSAVHAKTAKFIIDNYNNLIEDVARGEGEHLVAVLDIEGCPASSHANVISEVRTHIAQTVSAESYPQKDLSQKASDYYYALTSASASCTI